MILQLTVVVVYVFAGMQKPSVLGMNKQAEWAKHQIATLSNLQALKKQGGARKKARGPREQSEAEDTVTQEEEQEFDQREEEAGKKKSAAAANTMNTVRVGRNRKPNTRIAARTCDQMYLASYNQLIKQVFKF